MALKPSRPHMTESRDEEGALPRATRDWKCADCDYVHHGEAPPDACPECGAPGREFLRI